MGRGPGRGAKNPERSEDDQVHGDMNRRERKTQRVGKRAGSIEVRGGKETEEGQGLRCEEESNEVSTGGWGDE